jgi:hypothetical protein
VIKFFNVSQKTNFHQENNDMISYFDDNICTKIHIVIRKIFGSGVKILIQCEFDMDLTLQNKEI